jgi:AraC-like DNA-binding protein
VTQVIFSSRVLDLPMRGADPTPLAAIEDEARQALARRYVADPALGLAEVAYLLNFKDLSGFYRAFRRWTGRTPVEYRREHGPAHPGA